ncbi:hypothetical protein N8878_08805 [Psychromonas sp.]|nr:hypothetical protein [Psychromonas sp.]
MHQYIKNYFTKIEKAIINSISTLKPSVEEAYVSGFWLFYCDHTSINPPCFALNTNYSDDEEKWSPPEWDIDVIDEVYDALAPIYKELSEYMSSKSDDEWEELVEYQFKFYSELCLQYNESMSSEESPFNSWHKSNDFVIGIFEEREDEETYKELIISSIGSKKASALNII